MPDKMTGQSQKALSIGKSWCSNLPHRWPGPHWATGHPDEGWPLQTREPRRKAGIGWGEAGNPKKSMGIQAAHQPELANGRS